MCAAVSRCSASSCCSATAAPGSALSVLAVPILLTAPLTGGLLGALIAAGDAGAVDRPRAGLVRRPSGPPAGRGAGRRPADVGRTLPPGEPRAPRCRTQPADRPSAADVSTEQPSSVPPATPGLRAAPGRAARRLPHRTVGPPRGRRPWHAATAAVPAQVKVACMLTWAFSGVVALLYAGVMVALVVAKDEHRRLRRRARRSGSAPSSRPT